MTTLSTTAFVNGTVADGNAVNNNFQAVENVVNGNIDRTNLATQTRKELMTLISFVTTVELQWPDAVVTSLYVGFIVPDDYVSGDITMKLMRHATVAANTAVMSYSTFRFRDNAATTTPHVGVASNYTATDTNARITSVTLAAANFQAGDFVRWAWVRDGSNGSDTLAGAMVYDGAWIEYTGRA